MPEVLITSLSPAGHIAPLLNVAQGLVDRVTVLSSADHAAKIRAVGATPQAIPAEADFDLTRLDLPGRTETSGIKRVNFDIVRLFVRPMPHQTGVLGRLMVQTPFDAVIVDAGFFGILPFLLGDRAARPAVLAYTTTPLMIISRDTAPSGMGLPPSASVHGRLRNRALNLLSQKVLLRQSQNIANYLLDQMNSRPLPTFVLDACLLADRCISPTVPEFDYPRSDLPAHVRHVGAVHPTPSSGFRLPPWWAELDGDRPVVHGTQGTVDNVDLGRLVEATIEALGDEDVIVVATTGGRDTSPLR
jgi:UDP:flavonoid glycosyltransferase YjiC (YdhE family)